MLSLVYREQLDSLTNLAWPSITCQSVPWATHEYFCFLSKWSPVGSSVNQEISIPEVEMENDHDSLDVITVGKADSSKEELGFVTEDGELPSLISSTVLTDDKSTATLSDSKR